MQLFVLPPQRNEIVQYKRIYFFFAFPFTTALVGFADFLAGADFATAGGALIATGGVDAAFPFALAFCTALEEAIKLKPDLKNHIKGELDLYNLRFDDNFKNTFAKLIKGTGEKK